MLISCHITTSLPVALVLIDEVFIALAAAVTTASLVILLALLSKYRTLVKEATKATDLAKNLWDAMNARLMTQDMRIVDMMAKLEVYSVRRAPPPPTAQGSLPAGSNIARVVSRAQEPREETSWVTSQPAGSAPQSGIATKETQVRILQALLQGPRTSPELREVHGLTREHNARLLKGLYVAGLVVRNTQNKPYVYEITDAGRRYLSGT
jgi:predicted transcriptional regulator